MLSKEELYWGGFLASDGCVDSDNRVRLYLHSKDIAHLEKFKAYVNKPHKIQHSEKYPDRCAFEFTDRNYVEFLEEHFNIVPKKSLTYQIPLLFDNQYPDFFRGLFDGDGCICESFSNRASKTATLYATLTGSADCVSEFYLLMEKHLGIVGHIQNRAKYGTTGNPFSCVKYNTNKAKLLLSYLYKDSTLSTRLDRKFELYDDIIVKGIRLTR